MADYILFLVIGLCVGSFLNVLIDRIPNGESVWKNRSHCDHCKKTLRWYDLIPVLSWLALGGRCRYCHSPISIQYPLVELATGVSFVLVALGMPDLKILDYSVIGLPACNACSMLAGRLDYFYWLWIVSALIVIFVTDVKYGIIPDAIVFPTIVVVLIQLVSLGLLGHLGKSLPATVLSAIIGFGLFYFLHILTKGKGMGFGDVKFVFLMGLILGHPGLWIGLYVAFLTGATASVILILARIKKLKATIAFGPFLVAGTVVSVAWGEAIFRWWMKYII